MNFLLKIGLENGAEGRSVAWALEHPGCFATGKDGSEAILNMPRAFLGYCEWTVHHSVASWLADVGDFDLRLVETFECFSIDNDFNRVETQYRLPRRLDRGASLPQTQNIASLQRYEVNAWFQYDWKPLTAEDVRRGLLLLEWSRADLLDIIRGLTPEQRSREHPGERWSIDGILNHVGGAEWWYMDTIGMAGIERSQVSSQPELRLAQVRTRLRELLPALVGVNKVMGREGEFWSPRKVLRRALWHERDHTGHIIKLI